MYSAGNLQDCKQAHKNPVPIAEDVGTMSSVLMSHVEDVVLKVDEMILRSALRTQIVYLDRHPLRACAYKNDGCKAGARDLGRYREARTVGTSGNDMVGV